MRDLIQLLPLPIGVTLTDQFSGESEFLENNLRIILDNSDALPYVFRSNFINCKFLVHLGLRPCNQGNFSGRV